MKRKNTLRVLLVVLITISRISAASAVTIFPVEGQVSSYFPYTKEDELRYQAIYEGALSSAAENQVKDWEELVQHNIDYFAKLKGKDLSTFRAVFAAPDEDAISKETAVYTAYSAMEHLFDYTQEKLMNFYPACFFNVKDPENPFWYMIFDSIDREGVWGYYSFIVHVDAKDSLVLMITDNSGDAVG